MNNAALKVQIRDSIRNQRRLLTEDQLKAAEDMLADCFGDELPDNELADNIKNSRVVALYKAINGELSCEKVAEILKAQGKIICYPRVKGDQMDFYKVTSDNDFTTGSYGLQEPKSGCDLIAPEDIDVILVPGIAFTESGERLGQGGGFYDRYLNACKEAGHELYTVGLCYDFQIYSALPTEDHDAGVDTVLAVVTDDSDRGFEEDGEA